MSNTPTNSEYGTNAAVAEYFGIHIKTLQKWDHRPGLGFPRPILINGRNYRRWAEVHAFARRAAAQHAAKA